MKDLLDFEEEEEAEEEDEEEEVFCFHEIFLVFFI